jgi:hypothetical protein
MGHWEKPLTRRARRKQNKKLWKAGLWRDESGAVVGRPSVVASVQTLMAEASAPEAVSSGNRLPASNGHGKDPLPGGLFGGVTVNGHSYLSERACWERARQAATPAEARKAAGLLSWPCRCDRPIGERRDWRCVGGRGFWCCIRCGRDIRR